MRYLILLCFAGCQFVPSAQFDAARYEALRTLMSSEMTQIAATNQETITVLKEQTGKLEALRDEVARINAAADAAQASHLPPVTDPPPAEPADERPVLCVTYADFHCPPCERLRDAVAGGKLDAFRVRETPAFDGLKGYPAIRYESPSGSGKWFQVNGFDSTTIAGLTAKLIPDDVVHRDVGDVFEPAQTQREMDAAEHLRNEHGINPDGMTLAEMEAAHDAAHGGSGYHFPGYSSLSAPRNWTSSTSCPTCPTSQRSSRVSRRRNRR